jgi:hypothetical protein
VTGGDHPSRESFTIEDVLAWARTKKPNSRYDYLCNRCAVGQFLTDTGRATNPTMGSTWFRNEGEHFPASHEFDPRIDQAARGEPRTFGKFAERLEVLARESIPA